MNDKEMKTLLLSPGLSFYLQDDNSEPTAAFFFLLHVRSDTLHIQLVCLLFFFKVNECMAMYDWTTIGEACLQYKSSILGSHPDHKHTPLYNNNAGLPDVVKNG